MFARMMINKRQYGIGLSSIPLQEEDNMAIVEKMVADVDLDSNGEISFDEFCTMMDACKSFTHFFWCKTA